MPNRLARESSPYLLQHQHNPVDWHAWGPEALALAKAEDRPIFLSIGYSACHWCHVMEHESFENPRIAALMNENFVCIKVDREERPDLDQIYMQAVQMISGRGGWPLSMFLTPDLQPFFGGTYWPPERRANMHGFDEILRFVDDVWRQRRDQATAQAAELTAHLQGLQNPPQSETGLSLSLLTAAGETLERMFDYHNGGFGAAPKFPHPMDLRLLLRIWRRTGRDGLRQIVVTTLDKMAAGGIYDHLGGGFHRYSVDERWLVPHFEKMLYDNALLALAYLEGFLATGDADYARVTRETLDYVLRDMTDPAGGFYSTEDADSEGHEGKFYVWTPAEVEQVLGAEAAAVFCYVYDVSEAGNFEGANILNLHKTLAQCAALRRIDLEQLKADLARDRQMLLAARGARIRPGRDDKVLVSWNGLMIDALAQAAGPLGEPRYLEAARRAADFILAQLRRDDDRLLHSWRQGETKLPAYLDDYACFTNALVSLYEASFEERYLDRACELADVVLAQFANRTGGGFFFTADDHERLVARNIDLQDSSVPSGNAMAATALVRLAKLTGRDDFSQAAETTLATAVGLLEHAPTAAGQMLLALDMYLGPTSEIVILGDPRSAATDEVLADLRGRFLPNKVVALRDSKSPQAGTAALAALFAGKTAGSPEPTVYICQNFACQAPLHGPAAAREAWNGIVENSSDKRAARTEN